MGYVAVKVRQSPVRGNRPIRLKKESSPQMVDENQIPISKEVEFDHFNRASGKSSTYSKRSK
jgi:hypothetical protein